ncbi:hydroxymethylbilane synthase [bacterium J17]|nr:hydroxymethylbilane synthase [bacterium J17]
MSQSPVKLGTRKSQLALYQAKLVQSLLQAEVQLVKVTTTGDNNQTKAFVADRDKKDWIKEIEDLLMLGEVDFAVHSSKDVPVDIRPETRLLPLTSRASPLDTLVVKSGKKEIVEASTGGQVLALMDSGACVGTSSVRRRAQVLSQRSDLVVSELRGNVPTRLQKLDGGAEFDAIILAAAGLERLGLFDESRMFNFTADEMIPPVNQGILVAQYLRSRDDIAELLSPLAEGQTHCAWQAERSVIDKIEADCGSAVGVFAAYESGVLSLHAAVFSSDGEKILKAHAEGDPRDAKALGAKVGELLLAQGAKDYL